jgi:hypothetical protein
VGNDDVVAAVVVVFVVVVVVVVGGQNLSQIDVSAESNFMAKEWRPLQPFLLILTLTISL